MKQLEVGMAAPDFSGINQKGERISLVTFAGKKLILYFYPKDDTPGCTAESCNLSENYDYWISEGYEVVGVSRDSEASHAKFAAKYGLKFNLIADTEKVILQDYGVWGEKMNYGKVYMGVIRTTFVINEAGVLEKIFKKVDTKEHTSQIIKELLIK